MLNASVGVQRVIGRLRRTPSPGPTPAEKLGTKSLAAARHVRAGVGTVAESAQLLPRGRTRRHIAIPSLPTRVVIRRVGHDRVVALAVAGIVVGASALSILPAGGSTGDTGGPTGDGPAPRLAIGGAVSQDEAGEAGMVEEA